MPAELADSEEGAQQGGLAALEGRVGAVLLVVQHQLGQHAKELAEAVLDQGVVVADLVDHCAQAAHAALHHLHGHRTVVIRSRKTHF